MSDLKRHARPVSQCLKILQAIQQGEKKLSNSQEEIGQLHKALGLSQKLNGANETATFSDNKQQDAGYSGRKRSQVGQPLPRRYTVGDSQDGRE